MGSYMLLALFTMDSARLDSIILTMLFSGYNIETVHWALSLLKLLSLCWLVVCAGLAGTLLHPH